MKLFVPFFVTLLVLPFYGSTMDTKSLEEFIDSDGIYKIVTPENFNENNNDKCLTITQLDTKDGFLHASKNLEQIKKVLTKFFAKSNHVTIVELNRTLIEKAGFEIKEENGFPHIYDSTKTFHIPFKAIKRSFYLVQENNLWELEESKTYLH